MSEANMEIERVAKFGGTSMAQPVTVAEQLAYPGNTAEVVVVSAPAGLTSALFEFSRTMHPTHGQVRYIHDRVAAMAVSCDPAGTNEDIQDVVDGMSDDIAEWRQSGSPIMGLGEYWSARIFAAHTGRQFVDARDVVRFDDDGQLDAHETLTYATHRLGDGGQYVVPGYYGSDAEGRVHLLDRSGSDISAAILANVLNASRLDIWSDVPGFMSADPGKVADARLMSEITTREAREMYPGCALLHRDVLRFTGRAGLEVHMRHTFGEPGNTGTVVRNEREYSDTPIVGVVGMSGLVNLDIYEFGTEERSGSMADVFGILAERGIPFEDIATHVDGLSITFQEEHSGKLPYGLTGLSRGSRRASIQPVHGIKVVGEGLARAGNGRSRIIATASTALADAGVDISSETWSRNSVSHTAFVEGGEQSMDLAVEAVHSELF